VIEPFPRSIAAGDKFIKVPLSRSSITAQLCDTAGALQFGAINGIIAYGTGAPIVCLDVYFDIVNTQAVAQCMLRDHLWNNG